MSSQNRKCIHVFEDEAVDGLQPVVATRPAFELRYGLWNLRERVERFDASVSSTTRPQLRDCLQDSLPQWADSDPDGERVLLLNARLLVDVEELRSLWEDAAADRVARSEQGLHFAWVSAERARAFLRAEDSLEDLPEVEGPELARGLWNLVHRNGRQICEDFRELREHGEGDRKIFATQFDEDSERVKTLGAAGYGGVERAIVHPGVHMLEAQDILFGEGSEVRPAVVLDASSGPIVIGPGAIVHSQSVLVGPCFLGAGTVVNPGTRVRQATGVGAFCKLGGEVEDAIFLDLSNKQHDGFLGHAYVGQWANFGADTNGSDLKNDYGKVRVDFGDRSVDTGETFVGPLVGDHAKTSINTMLNTGTFVGVASNLFGAGFPPTHVPNFSWGGRDGLVEYRLDKALQTAKIVLGRRDVAWSSSYEQLLTQVAARTRRSE